MSIGGKGIGVSLDDVVKLLRDRFEEIGPSAEPLTDAEEIAVWAAALGIERHALLDAIGLHLARAFHDRQLDYEFCNAVANDFWTLLLTNDELRENWPPRFTAVFEAFEAGEVQRDPLLDPVEWMVRPLIAELLGIMN